MTTGVPLSDSTLPNLPLPFVHSVDELVMELCLLVVWKLSDRTNPVVPVLTASTDMLLLWARAHCSTRFSRFLSAVRPVRCSFSE